MTVSVCREFSLLTWAGSGCQAGVRYVMVTMIMIMATTLRLKDTTTKRTTVAEDLGERGAQGGLP